jgi:hypothetical protein
MKERIMFPEEFIPEVIAVIRRGLAVDADLKMNCQKVSQEVREQLGKQCDDLEDYWNGQ